MPYLFGKVVLNDVACVFQTTFFIDTVKQKVVFLFLIVGEEVRMREARCTLVIQVYMYFDALQGWIVLQEYSTGAKPLKFGVGRWRKFLKLGGNRLHWVSGLFSKYLVDNCVHPCLQVVVFDVPSDFIRD